MRIIGIDPGLAIVGFAILDFDEKSGEKTLIEAGVIRTHKDLTCPQRLKEIYEDMQEILREYKPKTCAIEQIFFSKNVTTGIKVSQARGVTLLALEEAGVDIHSYNPKSMKLTLTGDGNADKKAIQKMVMIELNLEEPPKPDDAADAVSLALGHCFQLRYQQ